METTNQADADALEELEQPDTAGQARALAEEIQQCWSTFETGRSNAACMLLLDPALRHAADDSRFAARLAQSHAAAAAAMPIQWTHINLKPEHRPILVPLQLDQFRDADLLQASVALALEDQIFDSLAQGAGHRVCGWLFTGSPIGQLASHLGQMAVQRLPDDFPDDAGKRSLLRYFDPSVMPSLWRLSSQSQRNNLLGPIDEWIMLDRSGALTSYATQLRAGAAKAPSGDGQIGYTTAQWMSLSSIGALNRVLMRWQTENGGGALPTTADIDLATSAMERARQHGIHDDNDLQQFAWHALTVDAQFDSHPAIKDCLKRLASRLHVYYTASIADLDDEAWQRIRIDMRRQPHSEHRG